MTHFLLIAFAVLFYVLIGVIYLACYISVMKPQPHDAQLGLTVLFWPVYIVLDVVLMLANQFGRAGKLVENRLKQSGAFQ